MKVLEIVQKDDDVAPGSITAERVTQITNFIQRLDGDLLQNPNTEIVVEGDKFENIKNATIINRSFVVDAFNSVKEQLDDETADALVTIAEAVEQSGNPAAGALFDQFNQEIAKPASDKGKLKQFWDGLVAVLPSVATLTSAVAKIAGLFAGV